MEVLCKYFVTVLSVLSISYTANGASSQFPCGYTYNSEAEGWFKLHQQAADWNYANDTCALEGAMLAAPTNNDIKHVMLSLMCGTNSSNSLDICEINTVHTSLRPTKGMKLDTPSDVDNKDIDGFVIALANNGHFQPVMPNIQLPYICYKQAPQVLPPSCDIRYPEYTWYNKTNQCYKFHRNRDTWWNAAITCLNEGANLAVINSEVEAQVIREIFALNPADVIPGDSLKDVAFLGFFADEDRNWYTLQGQSISDAGYENWAQGEPNNARGDEFCGSVGRDGTLYDDPCNREIPFICEKRTESCDTLQQKLSNSQTETNNVNINSILLKGRQRKQKTPKVEEDKKTK